MRRLARKKVVAISGASAVALVGGLLAAVMVNQASAETREPSSGDAAAAAVLNSAGVAPGASPAALAVTSRDGLTPVRTITDADGSTHVRYTRTYNGLRVLGGDLIVHAGPTGAFEGASVSLNAPLNLSTTPTINADRAKSASVAAFDGAVLGGASTGSVPADATAAKKGADRSRADANEVGLPNEISAPELVVDATTGTGVLAYYTVVPGMAADGQTPSILDVVVDAKTGKVISKHDEIETVSGTGIGIHTGTTTIDTLYNTQYSATYPYYLVDPSHGGQGLQSNGFPYPYGFTGDMDNCPFTFIETTAIGGWCNDGSDGHYLNQWLSWRSDVNTWGNGSHSIIPGVDAYFSSMADIHYGAAVTYDYYKNTFGRNGIFGNGRGILSLGHYGWNYNNAFFWSGGGGYPAMMVYGDGAGNNNPLTAIDVAAHEMSHGVTANSVPGGLNYWGESGGLNEATSDIFGTMVEFSAGNASDPGDYKIGEELFGDATPLRFMYQPSLDAGYYNDGNPATYDPFSYDCWQAGINDQDTATNIDSDPHFTSGVANHFFFLLAEGSGSTAYGTSPTCAGAPAVTGITRAKAAAIWYRALDVYFTSTTLYVNDLNPTNTGRAYTLAAAGDLYGVCSTEYKAVESAWDAVNVPGFSVCDSTPPSAAGAFVSVAPSRILDTRVANGVPGTSKVAAGGTVNLQVTGRGGVPASGVGAVVLNVTVTEPTTPGYVTAYPTGTTAPLASNLNFVGGQTIPNLVTVKLGTGGQVALTNGSGGGVHLIADVAGYYLDGTPTEAGTFVSLAPTRLLDTRFANGVPGTTKVPGNGEVDLEVAGRGDVPPTGAVAVVLNVTVVDPTSAGFVTVYPHGTTAPLASNLNFTAGKVIPNLVTVLLGDDGHVALKNGSPGQMHLIADVAGYYLAGTPTVEGAFVALAPTRILDTRFANGVPGTSKVPGFGIVPLQVTGRGGVPDSGAETVILNTTVTDTSTSGYATVYPTGIVTPLASNLNFVSGQTIPNLTITRLGNSGKVSLFDGAPGSLHFIADVAGYFL